MIEEVSDPQQKGPYLLNHERFHLHVQREKKRQENFRILASPFISQLLNNSSLSSLRPCDMFLNPSISMLGAAATPIEFSITALRKISSLVFLNKSDRPLPSISMNPSQLNLPSPGATTDQIDNRSREKLSLVVLQ